MKELEENPGWKVGQSGSRIADGNTPYIEKLEREMAEFWRADTCLIFNSGYEANGAIFSALPHKGDVILYDDLVHASIHDGMRISRACDTAPFKHNDMDAFRSGLIMLKEKHEQLRSGRNTLIVAIESVYSMDGDYSPVEEMIAITEEIYPLGNCQFFYDEAHSTGLMGPNERGMACALGIEKKLAVRLHTFGKAMGCNGAIVLGNETVRNMLINFSRGLIFTAGPTFPFVAAMRAAYVCLRDGHAEPLHKKLQDNIRYFNDQMFSHPLWKKCSEASILGLPASVGYEKQDLLVQIVPVWTQSIQNIHLCYHLLQANISAFPVSYPVVPKGEGRVRLVIHAINTREEIDFLVKNIFHWAEETYLAQIGEKPLTCTFAKVKLAAEAKAAEAEQRARVAREASRQEGVQMRAALREHAEALKSLL